MGSLTGSLYSVRIPDKNWRAGENDFISVPEGI